MNTLGDEMRDELQHQQWLIENGKLYDAMKQRAESSEARAAQLEAEQEQILEASSTLSEMLTDMWKERDELSAKLEQAQQELQKYYQLQSDINSGVIVLEMPRGD